MHLPVLAALLGIIGVRRRGRLSLPQTVLFGGLAGRYGDCVSEAVEADAFNVDRAAELQFRLRGVDG